MSGLLKEVESFVIEEFSRKVWNDFAYHNLDHTQNVVREARNLAKISNLSKDKIELLEIASWFHDLGYEFGMEGHEAMSIKIAKKYLSKSKLSQSEIKDVENLIKATRPGFERFQTISQKIIRDADLSNAGLKGFKKCSNKLRKEWAVISKKDYRDVEWSNLQIQYLSNLKYLSDAARQKYNKRKKKNLKKFKKRLSKIQLIKSF